MKYAAVGSHVNLTGRIESYTTGGQVLISESTFHELGPMVRVGDTIAGKYRILRVIGAGGMGTVVAARHVHLDTPVALKFLTEVSEISTERFLREAKAKLAGAMADLARQQAKKLKQQSSEASRLAERSRGIDPAASAALAQAQKAGTPARSERPGTSCGCSPCRDADRDGDEHRVAEGAGLRAQGRRRGNGLDRTARTDRKS